MSKFSRPNDREASTGTVSYPLIDVLRGFAAVSVLVYHVIEHFNWSSFPVNGPLVWFRIGWMGVDLFFVISGFVIALSAFSLIDRMGSGKFHPSFAVRRLRRIVPLHYLTCLIFLVMVAPTLLVSQNIGENIISHMLFLHNLNTDWAGAINGPNWTVAVEMQFYLLILLLAPVLRKCPWWSILLVAFPMAWCWRYWALQTYPIEPELGPYRLFWASTQLPGTLDQFAVGVLLARFMRADGPDRWLPGDQKTKALVLTTAAAVMIATMLALFWPRASFWDYPLMVLFWRTFAAATFGIVLLTSCVLGYRRLVKVSAPLRYLGTISYGIYLWHLPVLLSVQRIEGLNGVRALTYVAVLTIIFAIASWHLFEKPLLAPRTTPFPLKPA
jgi:peptidoglycan/LPS O-acetylase OafA/YrhL